VATTLEKSDDAKEKRRKSRSALIANGSFTSTPDVGWNKRSGATGTGRAGWRSGRIQKSGRGNTASLGPNFHMGRSTRVGDVLEVALRPSDVGTIADWSVRELILVNGRRLRPHFGSHSLAIRCASAI
jgi:hypothetical protein